jgi:hypothetical protein
MGRRDKKPEKAQEKRQEFFGEDRELVDQDVCKLFREEES